MDQQSLEDHRRLWLWHDENHSDHVMSTAKMVTTFASGIAAAFVAAGLQEGPPTCWDRAAVALLGLTFALTFFVLVVREKKSIPVGDTQTKSFADLHPQHLAVAKEKRRKAGIVHIVMLIQVGLAAVTSIVAIYPLLAGIAQKT
jgi:hypothetical protein